MVEAVAMDLRVARRRLMRLEALRGEAGEARGAFLHALERRGLRTGGERRGLCGTVRKEEEKNLYSLCVARSDAGGCGGVKARRRTCET